MKLVRAKKVVVEEIVVATAAVAAVIAAAAETAAVAAATTVEIAGNFCLRQLNQKGRMIERKFISCLFDIFVLVAVSFWQPALF